MTSIRSAILSDLDELYKLGQDVQEFSVNEDTINFWPKSSLENALESDDVIILVAENQSSLIGFIIATYNEGLKKSTIENIYVASEHRDTGVGDQLLHSLLDILSSRRCDYVATLIPENAPGASKLYKSAGFAEGKTFLWLDKSLSDGFKR